MDVMAPGDRRWTRFGRLGIGGDVDVPQPVGVPSSGLFLEEDEVDRQKHHDNPDVDDEPCPGEMSKEQQVDPYDNGN
jgi:hypothetical protein